MGGLAFSQASQINAEAMLAKIRADARVPPALVQALTVAGIFLNAPPIIQARQRPPAWVLSAHLAIKSGRWRFTTGETVTVGRGTMISPDYSGNDIARRLLTAPNSSGRMVSEYRPAVQLPTPFALELGITIPLETMAVRGQRGLELVSAPFMQETSSLGLVVVANRYRDGDDVRPFPDSKIVSTLFHELAVHAGRLTGNRPWEHGVAAVDSLSAAVDAAFR
jgi:hypothetical protein